MASGSLDSIILGFKDGPGPGDDFIHLHLTQADYDSPSKSVGNTLYPGGFAMSQVQDDDRWGQVRILTFTVMIDGKGKDDVIARLRNLNRFILRSNIYFKSKGGNPSSRSDGKWHEGQATVVTYRPAGASYEVYWDVISGTPAQPPDMITMQDASLPSVTFSLTVRANGRLGINKTTGQLPRVKLNNVVAMGDAAYPMRTSALVSGSNYGGGFLAGYTFSGTSDWQIMTDGAGLSAKYGVRTLTAQNTGTLTFTTNGGEVKAGDVVIPDIWIAAGTNASLGTPTVKMQIWNGATWTDQQTLVSSSALLSQAPSFAAPNWVRFTGTAYTVVGGITLVRLSTTVTGLVGSFGGAMGFDGLAIWKNPTGNVAPTSEYATGGKTMGIPTFTVYGIRGDSLTPIKLRVDNTGSQTERFFIIGGTSQDLGTATNRIERPVFALDLDKDNFAAATALNLPWGTLPVESTGAGTTSTYSLDKATAIYTLKGDRHQRDYRVFIIYAANDAVTISSVKLQTTWNSNTNAETKVFNKTLPNTYTGNTTPTASQYNLFELDSYKLSRPGITWEENTQFIAAAISLTHTSSANRHISIAGVILVPFQKPGPMAATLDIGTQAVFPLSVEIHNEGRAPRAAIQASPASGDIPVEINSYDTAALLKGGNFWVMPTECTSPTMATRFEILMLRSQNSTTKLYTFDATDPKQVSIEYTPRYLYGMAS